MSVLGMLQDTGFEENPFGAVAHTALAAQLRGAANFATGVAKILRSFDQTTGKKLTCLMIADFMHSYNKIAF